MGSLGVVQLDTGTPTLPLSGQSFTIGTLGRGVLYSFIVLWRRRAPPLRDAVWSAKRRVFPLRFPFGCSIQESASLLREVAESKEYVTLAIADQLFGIPVLQVQDVLGPHHVARIPLSGDEVAGSLNLRGRIVTVIDVRKRLGLPPRMGDGPGMTVVVEYNGELYSQMIDSVGEVMNLPVDFYERSPATSKSIWREFSDGVFRLKNGLLIVLAIERLLDFGSSKK